MDAREIRGVATRQAGGAARPAPGGRAAARSRLEHLQALLAALVASRDAGEVLGALARHAASALRAEAVLVAVRRRDGGPPEVWAEGLEGEAARLAGATILDEAPAPAIAGLLEHAVCAAEVTSGERRYGGLLAFSRPGFGEGDEELLSAYGRLAATMLDAAAALEMAEARQQTAEVLGSFAAELIRLGDTTSIAEATARAAREIVASDRAAVFRHDEEDDSLRPVAYLGYPPGMAEALAQLVLTAEDVPELVALFRSDEVRIYDEESAGPFLHAMMRRLGIGRFAAAAIASESRLFGVLICAWEAGNDPSGLSEPARRLSGLADQAAGAWEKALLLEQVHHHASIDTLTGLANRRVFTEMLARLLGTDGGPPLAVLFCDLDRFKQVNDLLGHAAGDELLAAVGRRLGHCVRSDDLVARLGGDEFTVLLTDVGGEWSPEVFAARVSEAMTEPVVVEGSEVVVHLSIGATVAVPGHSSVKEVLRRADAAMYVAKARGGDRLLTFEEHMLAERSERIELEAALAAAAADPAQFVVLYQPQVELASGEVIGAEALVRWQHPDRGLLTPDRFLQVAEETGLVVPIDLHVLAVALAQVAAWQASGAGLRVAVNFSARTLAASSLVARVEAELASAGVPGELLEIELTESTAVSDPDALGEVIVALGRLGVSVAIDDVGTGYSSLALLHKLPAGRLKIDRSFVRRITEDDAGRSVVEAVLLLADRLGQSVVAEGIETAEQAGLLASLGCDIGQGYLFARPGPAAELSRLLTEVAPA